MAELATFSELRSFSANVDQRLLLKQASESAYGKTVFLAHSSRDAEFLAGVVSILESHGGGVYIDKVDGRLPSQTNRETAEILRQTIQGCRRFVAFVTTNSKDSRWIPWELGLADGEKGANPVAIFPSAATIDDEAWSEQEYLGLYQRIVWGRIRGYKKPGWLVRDHTKNTAQWLRPWLEGR